MIMRCSVSVTVCDSAHEACPVFPGARIVNFDDPGLPVMRLEETAHYQITRGILEAPERYWRRFGELTGEWR